MKALDYFMVCFVIPGFFVAGCNCGVEMSEQKQKPDFYVSESSDSSFGRTGDRIFVSHRQQNGKDLGGVSQRPGVSIHWAGSDRQDSSVRPVDVIAITIDRMEAEQQTDLGSDKNARAMVLLMQAMQVLQGEDQEIDGVPVIK